MESSVVHERSNSCWIHEELLGRRQQLVRKTDNGKWQLLRVHYHAMEIRGKRKPKEECSKESDGALRASKQRINDSFHYVTLLKSCAEHKDLLHGSRVHADIIKSGLSETDAFVSNTLVSMYVKCGALTKGQELFDELPVRNLVSWTALLAGYAEYGYGDEALHCFELMQHDGLSPDAVSFACILKACGSIGAADRGEGIHGQIIRAGLIPSHVLVATALIDMYAKCGLLGKAQVLFDELPIRNVVSWNVLLTGYVQQGHSEEALVWFEKMHEQGVSPDTATCACILKACGSAAMLEKGFTVHSLIVEQTCLEQDVIVGTGLIDMYAKFGMLDSACDVVDELAGRNIVSWNALIAGYVQHGQGDEAWKCLERLQSDGLSPEAVTFTCLLKAVGIEGVLNHGQDIHAQVVKYGLLGKDVILGTALLDMYAKCGALEEAQDVFDELPLRNTVSWNALIAGYADCGLGEKALSFYEPMQIAGFSPSATTFVCTLKACGLIGALDKGQKIHAQGIKEGFLGKDMMASNALLDMYAKCGAPEKAREVFEDLGGRNEVSWMVLIAGYALHGQGEEALKCLERMQIEGILPDAVIYTCILKLCGSLRAAEKGQRIHSSIVGDESLSKDTDVLNALVEMYAKCSLFERAHQELQVQNVASWNALIVGYIEQGHNEKALECFEQMQCGDVSPDAATFVGILKACGNMRALDKGDEFCLHISKGGLLGKDNLISSAIVEMYVKCGALHKARAVFEELPVRNVVVWTVLLEGYVQHGHSEEVLSHFKQMKAEGCMADAVTFLSILKACGMIGAMVEGQELHSEIVKDGLVREHMTVSSALVDMYVKLGMLEEAQQIFDELRVRDIVIWNAFIAGYVQEGKDQVVFDLLHRMVEEGKQPDIVTFTILLNACSHRGLLDKGQMFIESMRAEYGITPTFEHYTCIIDLLCRVGHLEKATTIIKEMPFRVNLTIWHIVMGACQRSRNAVLGKWAFEQALPLDERNAAVFVSLGNLYAEG